ncbi:MAG: FliA/WhiG family RNA polymerase sigma factor [Candidatus Binatia bacterium]
MRADTSTGGYQARSSSSGRTQREEGTEALPLVPRSRGQATKKAKVRDQRSSQADAPQEAIDAYLPLVRMVAERIHRRLPAGIDLDSLIHSGIVGLMEALQRYDVNRGVTFYTYAHYRIQGEIIEYLRSLDWVSRSVRAWGRKMAATRSRLEGWLGREPASEEMAAELHISLTEYYRLDQKVSEATLVSLEELLLDPEGEGTVGQEAFCHNPFQDPLTALESKDLVEKLTAALETLSERERLVVTLYYYEELTLKEIGEVLGLTEGRICQIHAQAVSRLRPVLGGRAERQLLANTVADHPSMN